MRVESVSSQAMRGDFESYKLGCDMSRRRFLGTAVGVAASPAFVLSKMTNVFSGTRERSEQRAKICIFSKHLHFPFEL